MTRDFHQRFEIEINIDEAKKRFINRCLNTLFSNLLNTLSDDDRFYCKTQIATALGKRFYYHLTLPEYINDDFFHCLQAIEAFYDYLYNKPSSYTYTSGEYISLLNGKVIHLLEHAEVDLGVKWGNGKFIRTGAKLLDEKLINDSLRWLRKAQYSTVLVPFEKGLNHLLESEKNPNLLSDVITDMYEALESLAKIIVKNNNDISANREQFIKRVKASEEYKVLLKQYIEYANDFRHGLEKEAQKPVLSVKEVESFTYLTGIFIRLAMEG